MLKLLLVLLLTEIGSVDANAPFPETPGAYTVVALPDNYQSDPLSQDILNGFNNDPTLKALRGKTKPYCYTASDADWKSRFAQRMPTLPTVFIMEGDQLLYKRSGVGAKVIAADVGCSKFFKRLRPGRPGPVPCPDDQCRPLRPNQPNYQPYQPNAPYQPNPYQPNQPYQPNPNQPDIAPSIPPLIPDTVVDNPDLPPAPAIPDDSAERIKELEKVIDALQSRVDDLALKAGQAGPKGKDGEDGKNGKDGEDGKSGAAAVVDYDEIKKWIAEKPPTITPAQIDDLTEAVAVKLPPITFERLDGDGTVLDSTPVYLGKKVKFPALTVNYENDAGKILDTEYVPIGGTLNLHIDVLK